MSSNSSTNPSQKYWLILLLLGLIAAAITWYVLGGTNAPATPVAAPKPQAFPWASAASAGGPAASTGEKAALVAGQEQANQALAQAPNSAPTHGPIAQRPDYLSEFEWKVLKESAKTAPEPEKELTRLVNYIHFMKQLELWRSQASGTDQARRLTLANALEADLPNQIAAGSLQKSEADQIIAELHAGPTTAASAP